MYSSILSGTTIGIDAFLVRVEVDITSGLPGINLVGYLSTEAKEAKERVIIALKNAGFKLPPSKITINLSPANIKKGGTGFDVAIAIGMLVSMGLIPSENTKDILFIGELGLSGEIKPKKSQNSQIAVF